MIQSAIQRGHRKAGTPSAVLAVLLLVLPATGDAGRLVCWTDDNGVRNCGDSVPPRFADKQREVLDDVGRTVKVIPGALTPAQREQRRAEAERAAIEQRQADRRAAYERALLATYARPQELAALRDDRLATLDTRIRLTESAAARDAVSVAELRARLPAGGGDGKPGARLLASIAEFEASLAGNQRAIAEMQKQRKEICDTFARDIRRFQELKHGRAEFESPCPPPGSFEPAGDKAVDLEAARAFFQHYVELERRFDPKRFDLYAPDAVVELEARNADGQAETVELTVQEHREQVLRDLPQAQARFETYTYADLALAPRENGRVQVRARRISDADQQAMPFELVLQARGEQWQVVEQRAGSAVQ